MPVVNNVRYILLIFGLLIGGLSSAAEIRVSVDRNPVKLNESFTITFSATQEPDGNPDFSPLHRQFEILNQQRSSNVSWINGEVTHNEQWQVSVMAKQAGQLSIPPVSFGADHSQALEIVVSDAGAVAVAKNDEIFLEVEASPENPYVQSQVIYTLKLFRRVNMTQASLTEPDVETALVEKLGEDSTYNTQLNGAPYVVTERKYAIFPQQSGAITIGPLTVTAEVVSSRQPRFNGFFSRQITETRRVSSKAITLEVRPVPQNFKGSVWLSAESLALSEAWTDGKQQSRVGEPLTRTIRLQAKGATVGQLPELSAMAPIDGLKSYPDQPNLNEQKQSDGLLASREEKVAYIPNREGGYTLPAISIPWYNTRSQTMEEARLPAVTIQALPSATAAPAAASQPEATLSFADETAQTANAGFWPWLSAFLALGWLINGWWWFWYGRKAKPVQAKQAVQTRRMSIDQELKNACAANDPTAARDALLNWARDRFQLENLSALAGQCAEPLAKEVIDLNRHLYAGRTEAWHGEALWRAFFSEAKQAPKNSGEIDSALEPLYKL